MRARTRSRDPDGTWLTYRYRFGGPAVPEASGTIKAPSFLGAARRLLASRLADALVATPAYLRLLAAGEDEVVLRITQQEAGDGRPRLEVVPQDAFRFSTSGDAAPAS